jgi:hypothetical protein
MDAIQTEAELLGAIASLIGGDAGVSAAERRLLETAGPRPDASLLDELRRLVEAGSDPLGEAFCRIRSASTRRSMGAIYTPWAIVETMADWAARKHVQPARVVDPGAGSGRFLTAMARRFPLSELVAVEIDPLAALMLRANAKGQGYSDRLSVWLSDYRDVALHEEKGTTLFIGNPPYVRHHQIADEWKEWFALTATKHGLKASKLAGLHVHFFLRTLELANPEDYGVFITSAEWLDVNYGSAVRHLLTDGLGATAVQVLDPTVQAFSDAATTSVVTCFEVDSRTAKIRMGKVATIEEMRGLTAGRAVARGTARNARRWTDIIRRSPKPPNGHVELGDLFRVHRGQVTGGNAVWIASDSSHHLPERFLFPTVTKARELFSTGPVLADDRELRRVIDLPVDLDTLADEERKPIEQFLEWARRHGADESYIARNRRAWWSVGLKEPAPILCTYMARRAPAFVRNDCGARHINIAHGLYPRDEMERSMLEAILTYLRGNVGCEGGRTYAGGLTKYEPREVERLFVPDPRALITASN